ncbi:PREDICTED: disintegrin and metalloproteinase domain-containing protein 12 isoform X2 [Dinoponera quadriceps]|uniref:Disintegrin and metalloproteinase domain-containing protein 12 isoform X2 n=1 Tax=Dinoponera quadriceps TaxID=609295 RepID=A0A6P3YBV3_DINQU|nr:PREDICTED: disintegrin and metalloproteinase domain-containing protein 12 isoform X2 [Dinoponera quadriceps]
MARDSRRVDGGGGGGRDGGVVRSSTVRCKLVLAVLLLAILVPATHAERQGPSSDFSRHSRVRPRVYHGRTKRQISSTKENDIEHADVLTVGFNVDGVERVLDLRLNTDLIPVGYQQRYQHRGAYKVHTPSKVELCHYQGSVRDVPDSWVALSTCTGLRGVIFDGENLHHIHPEDESLDSDHYVYKHSDLIANNTCGYDGKPVHQVSARDRREIKGFSRYKRAAEVVRGPYNANRQSRYVELVLVIDKKEYIALNENLSKVYQHCKDIANIINSLYMPLNIFIALVGVQVWTESDEIALSPNGDTTLSNFLRYRREKLLQDIPNDNAQLLTRITFEGGVVGKALKGPICTYQFSGGVSMDHSNVVGLVAATVAHEMGHNFGMEHDGAGCDCPEDKCIMASSSGSSGPIHWSSCSLEHLTLAFEHGMDYCLRNKPQKLFDSPICGNGFVEPGEQCDCGLKENCDNPCCNVTTCMLHSNASCATGECCDLKTCRPKNAGTECRSADHECDLPEYCTGQSEYCPADVFKIDGETCNHGEAFCYQGSCRTHNDQCRLLWGPSGSSSDAQCYEMNNKGTKNGNCGYNQIDSSFIKCNDQNRFCGMLHCKHLNERLEFGMESVATLSHSFINVRGKIEPCRSAIVDLGLSQVDPGLTPDGAKCAPGKMCVNQKCMSIADLRASVSDGKPCPNNCNGNGVCNSLGHCHCNRGFRPPDCLQPGVGGSEDSGPVEDPNARNEFITALYVIFLGVVPVTALLLLGFWYVRNSKQHWKKGVMSTPMSRNIETIDSSLSQDPACASLLPKAEADERYNNNLFGQFKGFTITPIPNQSKLAEPTKPAPAPPTIPTVAIKTKPVQKCSAPRANLLGASFAESSPVAPTLPPLNPGSTARPLISSPVLAATTCTSVELKVPTRPAPEVPTRPASVKPQRPNSTPLTNVIAATTSEPGERKPEKGGTLNRIASILRPSSGIMKSGNSQRQDDGKSSTLPRGQHHKASKVLDKEILRNLEISHPIPQTEIEIATPVIPVMIPAAEKRNVVLRAQSMRDSKITPRPAIHTFGSMRQATPVKRPSSIPSSVRPTSPPPGPPADKAIESAIKIPGLPGYQNPLVKPPENTYDDCMNLIAESSLTRITEESPTNDNIYAVIEEPVPEKNRKNAPAGNEYKLPKRVDPTPGAALGSMGLLSEIVSEISNRNFDSIYSTSTLARKKKKEEEEGPSKTDNMGSDSSLGGYMNSGHYKTPGSVYSNSASGKFNSSSSTTSSGYLHPSAINVPQVHRKQTGKDDQPADKSKLNALLSSNNPNVNDELSKELGMKPPESPAGYKPFAPTKSRPAHSIHIKKDDQAESKVPAFNRTKTPPNIAKETPVESKLARQSSDNTLKSSKQHPGDNNNCGGLSSSRSSKSTTTDASRQTQLSKSNSDLDKDDPRATINSVSVKNVPCSPKDSLSKFNSPDLVSSCSNQCGTKSPDVVGSNPKFSLSLKTVQKAPTLPKGVKTPTTPLKPSSVASKTGLSERKKSPTGNAASITAKSAAKEAIVGKLTSSKVVKTEAKSADGARMNPVQRAASGKSNVASLQQKFEANKNAGIARTIPSATKKPVTTARVTK